eukprot:854153-Alexandrium_andersonii.AAC.1
MTCAPALPIRAEGCVELLAARPPSAARRGEPELSRARRRTQASARNPKNFRRGGSRNAAAPS